MKKLPLLLLLLAGCATALRAADVSVYAVTKAQSFTQTSTAAPVVLPTAGFTFGAIISPSTATSVTSATLRLPDATVKTFGPISGIGPLAVGEQFDTLAAMTAVYGSGNYTFNIQAVNDGARSPTLSLTGNSFPNTPTITNFTAAQNIDWTQAFTVTWGAFVGGNSSDYIQLVIERSNGTRLFATPDFGATGALTGTATSATIPANTFVPGQSYKATLTFGNVIAINLTAYGFFDFVPGATAFAKTTEFPMAAPGTTPILKIKKGTVAGSFDLTWNADIGRAYDLRRSQDFVTWTRVALVTATANTVTETDTPAATLTKRFYRLQEPP